MGVGKNMARVMFLPFLLLQSLSLLIKLQRSLVSMSRAGRSTGGSCTSCQNSPPQSTRWEDLWGRERLTHSLLQIFQTSSGLSPHYPSMTPNPCRARLWRRCTVMKTPCSTFSTTTRSLTGRPRSHEGTPRALCLPPEAPAVSGWSTQYPTTHLSPMRPIPTQGPAKDTDRLPSACQQLQRAWRLLELNYNTTTHSYTR